MTDLVAKRYVKALLVDADAKSIAAINDELSQISLAYSENKFNEIISSSEVKSSKKVEKAEKRYGKCLAFAAFRCVIRPKAH